MRWRSRDGRIVRRGIIWMEEMSFFWGGGKRGGFYGREKSLKVAFYRLEKSLVHVRYRKYFGNVEILEYLF